MRLKMIFVDTSAFLALLDASDVYHPQAVQSWETLLRQGETLLTNNYVLVETVAIVQHRYGLQAVQVLQEELVPFLQIEWVDKDLHIAAVERLLASGRRRISLVDCISFETMRRLGVETAFTFDADFRQEGFQVIPAAEG